MRLGEPAVVLCEGFCHGDLRRDDVPEDKPVNQDSGLQTPYVEHLPAVTDGFAAIEFAENPEPRVPCMLLLDTSGSMNGSPISELNAGIRTFKEELMADLLAAKRVEVAIVTFGTTPTTIQDFVGAQAFEPPNLHADGATSMGAAIEEGLRLLNERKRTYKENGVAYYRPWVFLITDGSPTDSVLNATQLVRSGETGKEFSFYGVGAGSNVDFGKLNAICPPERPAVKLDGLKFRELFSWLSKSMSSVSRSAPGTSAALPPPTGWITAAT